MDKACQGEGGGGNPQSTPKGGVSHPLATQPASICPSEESMQRGHLGPFPPVQILSAAPGFMMDARFHTSRHQPGRHVEKRCHLTGPWDPDSFRPGPRWGEVIKIGQNH